MTYVTPPFVSEREDAHFQFNGVPDDAADEDCVPCSLVMLALAAKPGVCPATLDEAERLRAAAGYGPLLGTAVEKYPAAFRARYGLSLQVHSDITDAELSNLLTPGMAASILTRPANFPVGHRLRRFHGSFAGLHQQYVANMGDATRWLIDPEGGPGYTGEPITTGELATLFEGSAALLPIAREASDMLALVIRTPLEAPNPRAFRVAPGVTLNGYDPAQPGKVVHSITVGASGTSAHADATDAISYPGAANPPVPRGTFLHVADGVLAGLDIVPSLVTLDPAVPVSQAELDAARAAGFAAAKAKAVSAVTNVS